MSDSVARLVVVDTSVAVKWFVDDTEDNVAEARELLEAHRLGHTHVCAPAMLPVELINALLWKGLGAGELTEVAEVLEGLRIALFSSDAASLGRAAAIATSERMTIYDALFPALASELGCVLVTADRKQANTRSCAVRLLRKDGAGDGAP
jgi:predicted nucleic acid-binding protein